MKPFKTLPVILTLIYFIVMICSGVVNGSDGIVSVVENGCNYSVSYEDGLRIQTRIDKKYYRKYEIIEVEFMVTNVSNYLIKLLFPYTNRCKIEVFSDGKTIYNEMIGDIGVSLLSIYNLRSGESIIYKTEWDQKSDDNKNVSEGTYFLKMTLIANPYLESGLVSFQIEE
jgi:hypothetical protein